MSVQQACKSLKQKGADMNEHQVHKRLRLFMAFEMVA
jgi:hypothetical protein